MAEEELGGRVVVFQEIDAQAGDNARKVEADIAGKVDSVFAKASGESGGANDYSLRDSQSRASMQVAIFGGDQDMPSPEAVLAPEVMKTWLDSLNDDGTNLRSLNKKLSPIYGLLPFDHPKRNVLKQALAAYLDKVKAEQAGKEEQELSVGPSSAGLSIDWNTFYAHAHLRPPITGLRLVDGVDRYHIDNEVWTPVWADLEPLSAALQKNIAFTRNPAEGAPITGIEICTTKYGKEVVKYGSSSCAFYKSRLLGTRHYICYEREKDESPIVLIKVSSSGRPEGIKGHVWKYAAQNGRTPTIFLEKKQIWYLTKHRE